MSFHGLRMLLGVAEDEGNMSKGSHFFRGAAPLDTPPSRTNGPASGRRQKPNFFKAFWSTPPASGRAPKFLTPLDRGFQFSAEPPTGLGIRWMYMKVWNGKRPGIMIVAERTSALASELIKIGFCTTACEGTPSTWGVDPLGRCPDTT